MRWEDAVAWLRRGLERGAMADCDTFGADHLCNLARPCLYQPDAA